MNIARHMASTIMQTGKTFQSNKLQRILGRSNLYFEEFCETWTTGDERIHDKFENLFVGVFR
jgi:hypothetical protein